MSFSVAQNTTFLTVASVAQKIVSFVNFTVVARMIGVGNTGSYFFALTFTTIFTVVADFGLGPILTREAAKFPDNTQQYFNVVFWSKIIFGIFAYALVILFCQVLNYSTELKTLIYLSAVTMFFDNIQGAFFSIFRAKKNLVFESFAIVGAQLLTLVIGTTALFLRAPLYWLILAYTIPSIVLVFVGGYALKTKFNIKFEFLSNRKLLMNMLVMAIPFALSGIIGRLYSYSDSIIMSKLLTAKDMGWWSVPYKITFAFQFIPVALSASVYPAMSSLAVSEPEKIGELFSKAWRYLFIIVFPLSFGLSAIAEPVIMKLYGIDYLPSVPVLRILLLSLIFSYLSIISGSLLNATGNQKIQTLILAVSLVCNLALNVYLIPNYGIIGAATAALTSNITLWALGVYFVRKKSFLYTRHLLGNGLHVLTLALFMSAVVYVLTPRFGFLLTIPIGALIYLILLYITGIITKVNIYSVWNKIKVKKV